MAPKLAKGKHLRPAILTGVSAILIAGGCSDHLVRTQLLGAPERIKAIRRIAIFPFECQDKALGGSIADTMGAGFMKLGFEVVERTKLATIVAEMDLQSTNLIQQDKLLKTGRLLGVEAMMFGSIQMVDAYDFASHWKVLRTITCRLVDIETGGNLAILTYSRETDLSSESVVDISDRLCADFGRRIKQK